MNRLIYVLAATMLLFAVSCGGGTTTLPTGEGDPGGGNIELAAPILPIMPTNVVGDHSVSIVPGQLNVLVGTDEAGLAAIASKYGYSVLHQDGPRATLGIPETADVEAVAKRFAREYNIVSAEPVHRIHTSAVSYNSPVLRDPSFIPLDPMYGDQFISFSYDGVDGSFVVFPGQAAVMSYMGFPGAWDLSRTTQISEEPVVVAIIDGGWFDYTAPANRAGFDESLIDELNSGFVAADGTFTPGLAATVWEMGDLDGEPTTRILPYRTQGELLLGMIAADHNGIEIRAYDFDGDTNVTEDEVWNDGIAGINPSTSLILIKTGELSGDSWSFTDNHVAESIDHAVGAGANIIVCGFFGLGTVGANVSTALQNARDNDVLVIAPAGDVIDSFNSTPDPPIFDDTPVDITIDTVTPASDPNCLSVAGTGFDRIHEDDLGDVDFGGGPIANVGRGWYFSFNPPFDGDFYTVADYCNTGADIAAVGFALGFGYHSFFTSGDPEPDHLDMGDTYVATVSSFGSVQAAGYVAGAASIVFQALSDANGVPPTVAELEAALLGAGAVDFAPLPGTDNGGFLNASKAIYGAFGGGVLYSPAMQFSTATPNQAWGQITRGMDFSITPTVMNGSTPFSIEIDWGNGDPPFSPPAWTNGDPVALDGGYNTLGTKAINITVTDADGQVANIGFGGFVINPLTTNISITGEDGLAVSPFGLKTNTQYRISANPTNVYTGDVGGGPNTTTFNWYFEGLAEPIPDPLPAPDATGTSVVHSFTNAATVNLTLVIEEDLRLHDPDSVTVTVSN